MLPSLSPLSSQNSAPVAVEVPMPRGFRPLAGPVHSASIVRMCAQLPGGITAAQKNGLRYEDKVQAALTAVLGPMYIVSPTIHFFAAGVSRCVIPDGLVAALGRVVIVEIKYQHMPEAWWQLRRLYQPVVKNLYPNCRVEVCEVCRTFDPAVPFPEAVELIHSPVELNERSVAFRVLPLKL